MEILTTDDEDIKFIRNLGIQAPKDAEPNPTMPE
jgi:hypothetical protein